MEGNQAVWYCYRQRAGPLVKECRALRPRYLPEEPVEDRRDKAQLKRYKHGGFDRRQVDRLEIRLALLPQGTHYTLSYGEEHLPGDFAGVGGPLWDGWDDGEVDSLWIMSMPSKGFMAITASISTLGAPT